MRYVTCVTSYATGKSESENSTRECAERSTWSDSVITSPDESKYARSDPSCAGI